MNKIIITLALITSFWTSSVLSVSLNPKGVGEVLIFPYYTVNNGFNTYYSIVNSSPDPKAIKINFLEGENSVVVLSFNVYLDAYDVWTGVLTPTTSTISGHVGEPSVMHNYNDNTCVPYLYESQEFLPYVIENDAFNSSMQRATDGHIEIIEMGTLIGSVAAAAKHDSSGIPNSCSTIESYWTNYSHWTGEYLEPSTGRLAGSATLLNVSSGYAVGYDAIALDNFFQGTVIHTTPGYPIPNLGNAHPESSFLYDNQVKTLTWQSGAEAVSSVLQQHHVLNEFNLDTTLTGTSEWVITYPSKYLHVNGLTPINPFTSLWDSNTACEEVYAKYWDNEEQHVPTSSLSSCFSVNVLEILNNGSVSTGISDILGSDNLISLTTTDNPHFSYKGWAEVNFGQSNHYMSNDGYVYLGLPVVGFAIEKFSNAAALPGILAQFANLYPHKTNKKIIADLIFMDGFENGQVTPDSSIDFFSINGYTTEVTINQDEMVSVNWSSSNANDCVASSSPLIQGWNGSVGTSGSNSVTVNQSASFTLTCGTASTSISVNVENNQNCSTTVWPPGLTKVEMFYQSANQGYGFGDTTNTIIAESFRTHEFLSLRNLSSSNQNFRRRIQFAQNPLFMNPNWLVTVSISECPGDFTQTAVCKKTIFPAQLPNILVSTNLSDDPNIYCLIEPNKPYYLNFVQDENPFDSTPGRCDQQSDHECGISFFEVNQK